MAFMRPLCVKGTIPVSNILPLRLDQVKRTDQLYTPLVCTRSVRNHVLRVAGPFFSLDPLDYRW